MIWITNLESFNSSKKDEIKNVIINCKVRGEEVNVSHIAEELGKNPNHKSVNDLIYAVMALLDIKNYKRKRNRILGIVL